MCWSEIKPQVIRCSEIDPKKKGRVKKETVAARGVVKPEGLACDWVTKKVSKALARISSICHVLVNF